MASMSGRKTDADEPLTAEEIRSKLCEYTSFVDGTLKPNLEAAVASREDAESEIAEYRELREQLSMLRKRADDDGPLESLVDLGHRVAYCRAEVVDPRTVFVHVGLGFHVELTLDQAVGVVGERIKFLEGNALRLRDERAKVVAGHIEDAVGIIDELRKKSYELDLER